MSLNMLARLQTKRCLVLVGLVILTAVVSFLVVFSQNHVVDSEAPDPEFPLPPSSMPMGQYDKVGVVSNGGACAQIGVDVMSRGGNAVDAAIATMLCDGALCPEYMGLGGGFLMTVYNATTKKSVSINARETAPAAADAHMFVNDPISSVIGGKAIGIPGELKGYWTLHQLYGGGVSWESLFQPTIKLCEEGIRVSHRLGINLKNNEELVKNDTMLRLTFFDEKNGRVKKAGDVYKLPKLAETMKTIAVKGADAFYSGTLTSQLLNDLKSINSIITEDDLRNYKVEVEEPVSVKLKSGHTLHSVPPPGSGLILAYILRILDGMIPSASAGLDAQRLVEAYKFGYGERSCLGDHRFVDVSEIYDKIRSDEYIDSVRANISDSSTSQDPRYYGADFDIVENHGTANMVAVDSSGNVVVGTSTLNTYFGCGYMSPSTGVILNNEMDDFSTPGLINAYGIPASPANFIEPGKRPLSSMCPTVFTDRNGDFVLGLGAAGGSKITLATAYVSSLNLWYNKTLKESVDKSRLYHQLVPMEVQYEYGLTRDVVQKLKDVGHSMKRLKNNIGSAVTAMAKSSSGLIYAMPDFRRPGNSSGN